MEASTSGPGKHAGHGMHAFDYSGFFKGLVDKKKADNSYRVFNPVNR